MSTQVPEVSVVVPMYDEEQVLALFFERLRPALDGLGTTYEVVCIDDGSRDRTAALVLEHRDGWPQLRLVRLLRNAGHQAALTAGFHSAYGDVVVTIDADLQDPPETIPEMVAVARREGVDVVYGVRRDRSADSWFKRTTGGLYYRLMRRVAGHQFPHDAGDFRLVTRRVVDAMDQLPGHVQVQVHRLMIPWFGFPSAEVGFVREERAAGETKYPLAKMVALAVDSLVAFSVAPLRLATWSGFVGGVFALGTLAWSVYGGLTGAVVPGWASIVATAGLIGAIQLLCLGLLGEYVSRIYVAAQGRPTYVVGYDSRSEAALQPPDAPGGVSPPRQASGPPRTPTTRRADPAARAGARPTGSPPAAAARPSGRPEAR